MIHDRVSATSRLQGTLSQFATDEHVLSPLTVEEVRARKIALIAEIGHADSIRDFGGLWGVHGLYLLEGVRRLGATFAEMIDVTPREEFIEGVRNLQAELPVQ